MNVEKAGLELVTFLEAEIPKRGHTFSRPRESNVFFVDGCAVWVGIRKHGSGYYFVHVENDSRFESFRGDEVGFPNTSILDCVLSFAAAEIMRINLNLSERKLNEVEASEIGLEPGSWPQIIKVDNFDFRNVEKRYNIHGDDLVSVVYETSCGRRLIVFND